MNSRAKDRDVTDRKDWNKREVESKALKKSSLPANLSQHDYRVMQNIMNQPNKLDGLNGQDGLDKREELNKLNKPNELNKLNRPNKLNKQ